MINSIRNREQLPEQCQVSIIAPIHQKGNKTECINYTGKPIFVNYVHNFIHHLAVNVTTYAEEITRISSGNSAVAGQLQIIHSSHILVDMGT
jgi:hypothetical protein